MVGSAVGSLVGLTEVEAEWRELDGVGLVGGLGGLVE